MARSTCLLCFTCHEAKMYGPTPELHCDIADEAYERVTSLLNRYRRGHPDAPKPNP